MRMMKSKPLMACSGVDCITMSWCAKSHAVRALGQTTKGAPSIKSTSSRSNDTQDSGTMIRQTKGLGRGACLVTSGHESVPRVRVLHLKRPLIGYYKRPKEASSSSNNERSTSDCALEPNHMGVVRDNKARTRFSRRSTNPSMPPMHEHEFNIEFSPPLGCECLVL